MSFKANKREILKVVLIAVSAILLLGFAYRVFYAEGENKSYYTKEEVRLCNLLSEIKGVGRVSVIINEDKEGAKVVIVCEGADDLRVCSEILQAVRLATGAGTNDVIIYKMGE